MRTDARCRQQRRASGAIGQVPGVRVAVERVVHAPATDNARRRAPSACCRRGRQDLGRHAQRARVRGGVRLLSRRAPSAPHQRAALRPAPVVRARETPRSAGTAGWCRSRRTEPHARPGARSTPARSARPSASRSRLGPRPYVESSGLSMAQLPATHHAGGGQRDHVAGHDHPRVAERAALVLGGAALHHGHAQAALGCVVRRAQAHDAAADDQDVAAHAWSRMPQRSGSLSSEEDRGLRGHVRRARDERQDALASGSQSNAPLEHAAGHALLPPRRRPASAGCPRQAGQLGAGAGPAGRAVAWPRRGRARSCGCPRRSEGPKQLVWSTAGRPCPRRPPCAGPAHGHGERGGSVACGSPS